MNKTICLAALVSLCFLGAAAALVINAQRQSSAANLAADRIVIEKAARTLSLYHGKQKVRTYRVALGRNPVGHKRREGDGKTPEGLYTIDSRNARSAYHKSLHVSYPNARDRETARKLGVSPGGDIFIHGLPNGYDFNGSYHLSRDWTLGCIAVTNEEIEEIWRAVPNGTPVEIRP